MRFLIDSHALLWLLYRPDRMARVARMRLEAEAGGFAFSIVSVWELQIKFVTGKLDIDLPDWVELRDAGTFDIEPVTVEDAIAAAVLPLHHRDPFDRMIIAQAQRRGMTIVSRDRVFEMYDAPTLAC